MACVQMNRPQPPNIDPHLKKYEKNGTPNKEADKGEHRTEVSFENRKPYQKQSKHQLDRISVHNGQRKLLISEIDFLTKISRRKNAPSNIIVLYIGAASGKHINMLTKLFPKYIYHLYDKMSFHETLYDNPKVKIFKKYMDDEIAESYREMSENIIMISDIRNLDIRTTRKNSNSKRMNNIVSTDLDMQKNWVNIIKPIAASLKFRLPWQPGKTEYFSGEINHQCWEGPESAETRMFLYKPDHYKIKEYDHTEYEEALFYFNQVMRRKYYKHNCPCYGHCYDCWFEVHVLEKYLKSKSGFKVCKLGREISELLKPLFADSDLRGFGV